MSNAVFRMTVLFAVYASLSSPAYAYLDPATGSIAVQALIGAVATWIMYSRMFARKAKQFLSRLAKGRGGHETE